jgi:hypothetical protein
MDTIMRLLWGISNSQIKVWRGWQFLRGRKDTWFILWDGTNIVITDHGMSIANWVDAPEDDRFMRDFFKFIFEADEIKDTR